MADLSVDLAALAALGSDLGGAREQLTAALSAMRDVGEAPLGTADLDAACAEFQQGWSYGLGKLDECVGKVRGGVDATATTYGQVEQALTDGFAQARASLGGGA